MFRDFLIGTVATILRVIFIGLGIVFLFAAAFWSSIWCVIIGVVFLCMAGGVRYALGQIVKVKDHNRWRQ